MQSSPQPGQSLHARLKVAARSVPGMALFGALILTLLPGVPSTVHGDEGIINVFAETDADEIGMLDTLTLTVTVEAENIKRMPKPEVPAFRSFDVLNESTKTQTSLSIVNGKASRRKIISFVYTLKPKTKGVLIIDPVRIGYDGEVYKTEPLQVTVVEGMRKGEENRFMFRDYNQDFMTCFKQFKGNVHRIYSTSGTLKRKMVRHQDFHGN